jgi:hypothetical protein
MVSTPRSTPRRPHPDRARRIEEVLLSLLAARGGKTICPSEVARAIAPHDFRTLMPAVRAVAAELCARGAIVVTQRGRAVDVARARGPVRLSVPSRYHGVDFRAHPEAYRVGRGEEGVLSAEPYMSELLPLWRFRTPDLARRPAIAVWNAFVRYRRASDFVGMDMARKFLQMGFTRARRYANPSGRSMARTAACYLGSAATPATRRRWPPSTSVRAGSAPCATRRTGGGERPCDRPRPEPDRTGRTPGAISSRARAGGAMVGLLAQRRSRWDAARSFLKIFAIRKKPRVHTQNDVRPRCVHRTRNNDLRLRFIRRWRHFDGRGRD